MRLLTIRPPLQLALCAVTIHRLALVSSLPIVVILSIPLYILIELLVVIPLRLFVYVPFFSPLRSIPSPPRGLNTWRTWLAAEPTPPQLLEWVDATARYYGNDFRGVMRYYGIGGGERLLLTSSSALREVLVSKQYEYFDRPTMARKRIAVQAGNGLIASGGEDHKNQKRKLLPAFNTRAINELYPLFCTKANELVAALHKETGNSGKGVVEIVSWTSRAALDIIGTAAWGTDFKAISEPDSFFLKSYGAMFDIRGGGQFINALGLVLPMSVVLQIPCAYNRRLKAALHTIRSKCAEVVKEKEKEFEESTNQTQGKDILSRLIEGGVVGVDVLVDQMMTILAAGHDTSSLTLSWACFLMCKHSDVQQQLRAEIRARLSLGKYGFEGEIVPETLESMPYLNAVANETLRLMTAVPLTRRETLKATEIQGYYIPQGAHMVSSGYVTNRIESEWDSDARDFVPERWLKPNEDSIDDEYEHRKTGVNNKFAFHSFSHGPRACIGQGFARGEFLVFLAALVGSFVMELEDPTKEPVALFGITMSPEGGIRIRLKSAQ